jgi:hypothetical protein
MIITPGTDEDKKAFTDLHQHANAFLRALIGLSARHQIEHL